MLFNSPQFLFVFLPIAILGFVITCHWGRHAVVSWLAIASLAFYAYWRPPFLLLLAGSILVNYTCAGLIWKFRNQERLQKAWMILGICLNLGTLCFFKYLFPTLHFFERHDMIHFAVGDVILPLGISFFTFTQIGYLVDLAQGAAEPQDFISYVLFVTFFPHLIAGPIIHHREIMPQFAPGRKFALKGEDFTLGLSWFVLGLAKKVLIADRIARFADVAFAHSAILPLLDSWLGALIYLLQLYFDFSGYSDMAIGLAKMFSIDLPINFNSPYKARNIIEYWQRWHMTLTRYLTLYLYNPMSISINRRRAAAGKASSRKAMKTLPGFVSLVATPTILTMFLAGIWHGAGLQFLIFGVLHGVYITLNHAWRIFAPEDSKIVKAINWQPASVLVTFFTVCIAEVFFRANNTSSAFQMLAGMFGAHGLSAARSAHAALELAALHSPKAWAVLFILLPVVWFFPNTQEILGQVKATQTRMAKFPYTFLSWRPDLRWAASLGIILIAILWKMTDTSSFLYFQF